MGSTSTKENDANQEHKNDKLESNQKRNKIITSQAIYQFVKPNKKALRLYFESHITEDINEEDIQYLYHIFEIKTFLMYGYHHKKHNLIDVVEFSSSTMDKVINSLPQFSDIKDVKVIVTRVLDPFFARVFSLVGEKIVNVNEDLMVSPELNIPSVSLTDMFINELKKVNTLRIFLRVDENTNLLYFILNNISSKYCPFISKIIVTQVGLQSFGEEMFAILGQYLIVNKQITSVVIQAKSENEFDFYEEEVEEDEYINTADIEDYMVNKEANFNQNDELQNNNNTKELRRRSRLSSRSSGLVNKSNSNLNQSINKSFEFEKQDSNKEATERNLNILQDFNNELNSLPNNMMQSSKNNTILGKKQGSTMKQGYQIGINTLLGDEQNIVNSKKNTKSKFTLNNMNNVDIYSINNNNNEVLQQSNSKNNLFSTTKIIEKNSDNIVNSNKLIRLESNSLLNKSPMLISRRGTVEISNQQFQTRKNSFLKTGILFNNDRRASHRNSILKLKEIHPMKKELGVFSNKNVNDVNSTNNLFGINSKTISKEQKNENIIEKTNEQEDLGNSSSNNESEINDDYITNINNNRVIRPASKRLSASNLINHMGPNFRLNHPKISSTTLRKINAKSSEKMISSYNTLNRLKNNKRKINSNSNTDLLNNLNNLSNINSSLNQDESKTLNNDKSNNNLSVFGKSNNHSSNYNSNTNTNNIVTLNNMNNNNFNSLKVQHKVINKTKQVSKEYILNNNSENNTEKSLVILDKNNTSLPSLVKENPSEENFKTEQNEENRNERINYKELNFSSNNNYNMNDVLDNDNNLYYNNKNTLNQSKNNTGNLVKNSKNNTNNPNRNSKNNTANLFNSKNNTGNLKRMSINNSNNILNLNKITTPKQNDSNLKHHDFKSNNKNNEINNNDNDREVQSISEEKSKISKESFTSGYDNNKSKEFNNKSSNSSRDSLSESNTYDESKSFYRQSTRFSANEEIVKYSEYENRDFGEPDDLKMSSNSMANKQYIFLFYQSLALKNNLLELRLLCFIYDYSLVQIAQIIRNNKNLRILEITNILQSVDTRLNEIDYTYSYYNKNLGIKIKDEIFIFFNYLLELKSLHTLIMTKFWFNSDINFLCCQTALALDNLIYLDLTKNQALLSNANYIKQNYNFSETNLTHLYLGRSYFNMMQNWEYIINVDRVYDVDVGVLDFISFASLMRYVKKTQLSRLKMTLNKSCDIQSLEFLFKLLSSVFECKTLRKVSLLNAYSYKTFDMYEQDIEEFIKINIAEPLKASRTLNEIRFNEDDFSGYYTIFKDSAFIKPTNYAKSYAIVFLLKNLFWRNYNAYGKNIAQTILKFNFANYKEIRY